MGRMEENKKKIIITGGAGFIGSNLADELVAQGGYEVHVIDNLKNGIRSNIPDKAVFHKLDIEDYYGLLRLFKRIGDIYCVFHMAALPRVQFSIKKQRRSLDTNIDGTLHVLLAAKNMGVRRVVYSASSSAYGDQTMLPLREEMAPNPKSPYGIQKLVGEYYTKVFYECYGLETVSLRYFNVYGPKQNDEGAYALVIGVFLNQHASGEPLTITGDGKQTRDFTNVKDVVRANIIAMESPSVGKGEVINIGAGRGVSILELARLIGGEVKFVEARIEPHHTHADNTQARELLGWTPRVSIEEGIAELKRLRGLD